MSRTDDSGKDEEAFLGQASEPVSGMLSLLGDVDKLIKTIQTTQNYEELVK